MEKLNQDENNFVWDLEIKNLTFQKPKESVSDTFLIAGNLWRLLAVPKGTRIDFFYQNLDVSELCQSLMPTLRRLVKLRLTIVNKISAKLSFVTDTAIYMDGDHFACRYPTVPSPPNLLARHVGFLVDGVVTIAIKVVSLDVVDKADYDALSYNLNGFEVLPSRIRNLRLIESVKRIFERYPDLASEVHVKNQCLRTTYMNVLLGIIATLCQLPDELSDNDLDEASVAVKYVAKGGFKVDWLEKKLEEVKEKKKKVDTCKDRQKQMKQDIQKLTQDIQKLNRQRVDLRVLIAENNATELATNVPLSFNDVV